MMFFINIVFVVDYQFLRNYQFYIKVIAFELWLQGARYFELSYYLQFKRKQKSNSYECMTESNTNGNFPTDITHNGRDQIWPAA